MNGSANGSAPQAQGGASLAALLEGLGEVKRRQSEMDSRHKASQEAISERIEAMLELLKGSGDASAANGSSAGESAFVGFLSSRFQA